MQVFSVFTCYLVYLDLHPASPFLSLPNAVKGGKATPCLQQQQKCYRCKGTLKKEAICGLTKECWRFVSGPTLAWKLLLLSFLISFSHRFSLCLWLSFFLSLSLTFSFLYFFFLSMFLSSFLSLSFFSLSLPLFLPFYFYLLFCLETGSYSLNCAERGWINCCFPARRDRSVIFEILTSFIDNLCF